MRLLSLYIENFGKLSNLRLDLERGLNVIFRENGWGKSTLAAFIRVMLYGFSDEKSRDALKNERKRYSPWQGGVYGGSLEFEANGVEYVAERTFGMKEKEDKFSLRRKDTNLECTDYSQALGEELFYLDSASFLRTVFLSQNDCETMSTDSINAKIGNLAEDTDDINNYENVNSRFLALQNQMSPTRKTGSLYRQKILIAELEEELRGASGTDQAIDEAERLLGETVARQSLLRKEQADLIKKQQETGELKSLEAKRERYGEICREFEDRKKAVERDKAYFPGKIPDNGELERQIEQSGELSAARESVSIFSLTEEELRRKGELLMMFPDGCPSEETFRRQEDDQRKLQELRILRAKTCLSPQEEEKLKRYEAMFSEGVPEIGTFEKITADWSRCLEKSGTIGQKEMNYETLKSVARASELDYRNRRHMLSVILFVLGAAAAFGGIVCGVISMLPMAAVSGAAAVLCFAAGAIVLTRGKKHGEESDAAGTEGFVSLYDEIENDRAFIAQTREDTLGFLAGYGMYCDRDEDVTDSLYELKASVREYIALEEKSAKGGMRETEEDYERLSESIRGFLGRFYPPDRISEENYGALCAELKEMAARLQELEKKSRRLSEAKSLYSEKLLSVREFMDSLSMDMQEDTAAQLRLIKSRLQSLSASMAELERVGEKKRAFEEREDMERITDLKTEVSEDDAAMVNDRLEEIAGELERLYEYASEYNRRLEQLRERSDELDELRDRLELMRQEYMEEKRRYELIGTTRDFLEKAKLSLTARYTEPVRNGLEKYFKRLSGEGAENIFVDANTKVTVKELGIQRDLGFLSAGRRDMMGICLRMALTDVMYREEKPFLIFDDPFVNLDDKKLESARVLLDEIAEEYQILYLTCHGGAVPYMQGKNKM